MLTKDVVEVVYGLRKQRKLNCEQVGKVLGYKTGKGYRDIEIGRVELTVNHVLKLSEFLPSADRHFFCAESLRNGE